MTVPTYNLEWEQGEDGTINMIYKAGDPAAVVNLTGWQLRMDIATTTGTLLYTLNTDDSNPATTDEATLGTQGEINVTVPRATSLGTGPLATYVGQTLKYDIFLRDNSGGGGKQTKILKGSLVINSSVTLWE